MQNVLLITVDSLRVDRVTEEVMPFARSLADDALEFTGCVANGPSTPASFPTIHASQHFAGIEGLGIPERNGGVVTLAERLREAGYATAGFTDNHFASGSYHYDRGFDSMHDASGTTEAGKLKQFVQSNLDKQGQVFKIIERVYTYADAMFSRATETTSEYERAESLNARALDWIDGHDDWFVWLHYMDVHHPYEAPLDYQRRFLDKPLSVSRCRGLARKATHHPKDVTDVEWRLLPNLYDAECAYTDDQLRKLVTALRERGTLEDTLLVFTADHGELVGEHGQAGHPPEFWEEIIRVPLVVSGIESHGASTVNGQVRLLDVAPTIAESVGLDAPPEWEGESALALARGDVDAWEWAFGDVGRDADYAKCYARRADGWKLLRHADGEFCFNIAETPAERPSDDRRESEPEEYQALGDRLNEHQQEMSSRRRGSTGVAEDEAMVEDHLRELGYLE